MVSQASQRQLPESRSTLTDGMRPPAGPIFGWHLGPRISAVLPFQNSPLIASPRKWVTSCDVGRWYMYDRLHECLIWCRTCVCTRACLGHVHNACALLCAAISSLLCW